MEGNGVRISDCSLELTIEDDITKFYLDKKEVINNEIERIINSEIEVQDFF